MKFFKKSLAIMLVASLTLSGCGGVGEPADVGAVETADGIMRKELNTIYSSEITELNYLKGNSTTVTDMALLIVDGLIQYNQYDELVPNMAISWENSSDGLTWTFKLREGLKWYDNKGEVYADVTAQDYVDALQYVLTAENAVPGSGISAPIIKNGKAYLEGEITDFSQVGIKAVDDLTLEYTLEAPVPYFMSTLCHTSMRPICKAFMDEMGDVYATSANTMVTSGAYLLTTMDAYSKHVYTINPEYWDAENMYISVITRTYNTQSDIATTLYDRGETAFAAIPDDIIDEWMADPEKAQYVVKGEVKVNTNTFKFNYELPNVGEENNPEDWQTAVFNENFRKAVSYGIDRVAAATTVNAYAAADIVNNTLTPAGYIFTEGGVDYTSMGSLAAFADSDAFNPELALKHKELAMAELEGQVEFPIKMVYSYVSTSNASANRVQVIEQQLENLLGSDFIDVVINAEALKALEIRQQNKYCMIDGGYSPDYRDPANYAMLYVSTNSLSDNRGSLDLVPEYMLSNGLSEYDELALAADAEKIDVEKRYALYAEAEAYLLEKALVLPFYESAYSFQITSVQPFYCYHTESGLDTLKGARLLDETVTTTLYDELQAQIIAEKAAR